MKKQLHFYLLAALLWLLASPAHAVQLAVGSRTATLSATVGTAISMPCGSNWYTSSIHFSNFTYTQTGGTLPAGLSLNVCMTLEAPAGNFQASVRLAGTPTVPGTGSVTFTIADGTAESDTYTVNYTIAANLQLSASPGTRTVGQTANHQYTASGGAAPYTFQVVSGTLPPGTTLSSNGLLSGTYSTGGNHSFQVRVTDDLGNIALFNRNIIVANAPSFSAPFTIHRTQGQYTLASFSASGGAAPLTYSADGVPPGMTFAFYGQLEGTATTAGSYSLQVTVTDNNGFTAQQTYPVEVAQPPVMPPGGALPLAPVGVPYSYTFTASGGRPNLTYTVISGALPPGLNLNPNGLLNLTPTVAGDFSFQVRVTDANGAHAVGSYTLSTTPPMSAPAPNIPPLTPGMNFQFNMPVDGGTAPYSWTVESGNLPAGITLSPNGTLSGSPTTPGQFSALLRVTDHNNQSATVTANFDVKDFLSTSLSNRSLYTGDPVAAAISPVGGVGPYQFSVSQGQLPPGIAIANGELQGTPTAAGQFQFTFRLTDANTAFLDLPLTWTISAPLQLLSTNFPEQANLNSGFSYTFSTSGGHAPVTLAVSGPLPPGLQFDAATGALTGTLTQAGQYQFMMTATDHLGKSAQGIFRVNVGSAPRFHTSSIPTGMQNRPYFARIELSGDSPIDFVGPIGSLPGGLEMQVAASGNRAMLTLSGAPENVGNVLLELVARDREGRQSSALFTLFVHEALVIDGVPGMDALRVNQPFQFSLTAKGGVPPYRWSAPALPAGANFEPSNASLSGKFDFAGTFPVLIRVTDDLGNSVLQPFTLDVDGPFRLNPTEIEINLKEGIFSKAITITSGNGTEHSILLREVAQLGLPETRLPSVGSVNLTPDFGSMLRSAEAAGMEGTEAQALTAANSSLNGQDSADLTPRQLELLSTGKLVRAMIDAVSETTRDTFKIPVNVQFPKAEETYVQPEVFLHSDGAMDLVMDANLPELPVRISLLNSQSSILQTVSDTIRQARSTVRPLDKLFAGQSMAETIAEIEIRNELSGNAVKKPVPSEAEMPLLSLSVNSLEFDGPFPGLISDEQVVPVQLSARRPNTPYTATVEGDFLSIDHPTGTLNSSQQLLVRVRRSSARAQSGRIVFRSNGIVSATLNVTTRKEASAADPVLSTYSLELSRNMPKTMLLLTNPGPTAVNFRTNIHSKGGTNLPFSISQSSARLAPRSSTVLEVSLLNAEGLPAGTHHAQLALAFSHNGGRETVVPVEITVSLPPASCVTDYRRGVEIDFREYHNGMTLDANRIFPVSAQIVDNCGRPVERGRGYLVLSGQPPTLMNHSSDGKWFGSFTVGSSPNWQLRAIWTDGQVEFSKTITGSVKPRQIK